MRLIVTAKAEQHLDEIEEYIGLDIPSAAVDFVSRLTERFQELAESPGIGRKRDDLRHGMRSSRVGEYLIFYRDLLGGLSIIVRFRRFMTAVVT